MTLLSHPDTPGHGDDKEFTLIRPTAGHWTTPLRAAIPLEVKVIASSVDTPNTFSVRITMRIITQVLEKDITNVRRILITRSFR
jgi:hypothetical protein